MKNFVKWFEIPATDIVRAVSFYEQLFGMKLEVIECGTETMAFFPKDELNVTGAISVAKNFNPSSDGVVINFDADGQMKLLIDKVKKLGGEIITDRTKIEVEGIGYFALVKDSEGNRIGFHSVD